jgi:hypothetical protein
MIVIPLARGAVGVASEILMEKRRSPDGARHNWSLENEDPFLKWEVHNQSPKERNPHARQDYSHALPADKGNRDRCD